MECVQFAKRLEEFSEGQKKKVLIAASLMTPAHVYIWDEPLNYIDVFSRMQIEQLILRYQPIMISGFRRKSQRVLWNCKAVIRPFLQFDSQKRRIKNVRTD